MSAIPRYRVMNWWEHGVREPDSTGRRCHVRGQDANVDEKYVGASEIELALEMCDRQPCVCRGEAPERRQR